MVLPLSSSLHGRLQGMRGRSGQRLFWISVMDIQRTTAKHAGSMQRQYQKQDPPYVVMGSPVISVTRRTSIFRRVGDSVRCSTTATAAVDPSTSSVPLELQAVGAAATTRQAYKFKSAAHHDMVVLSTRLHLQDLLLHRFGRLRTAECCLLRKPSGTPRLLLLWAGLLVQNNPENPPANAYFVPPELYRLPEVKALLQSDRELRWLMQRIDPKGRGGVCDSSRDCVPVPHFPSVLQQELPRYPYEPYQLELLRDTYGLLKWPFRPVRRAAKAVAAAAAAVAAGDTEPPQISQAEPTSEGVAAAVAAIAAAVDRGDVQRANSKVRTGCCTDVIYAPDETETGAYIW